MASIRPHRAADGSVTWAALWRENGRQRSATFTTEDLARKAARYAELRGTVPADFGHGPHATITVADVLAQHIRDLTDVTAGTRADYTAQAATYIVPHIGDLPIDMLTRSDVAALVNRLLDGHGDRRPLASKTVANVHGLLSAALATAVDAGHATRNVAARVGIPAQRSTAEPVFLTTDEYRAIVEHAALWLVPLCDCLWMTGMRFGEATALTPADCALTGRDATLRISKAWKSVRATDGQPRRWYVGPPKTAAGNRTIVIPHELAEQLRQRVRGMPRDSPVYPALGGERMTHGAAYKAWARAVAASGIDARPRLHDLRHTHASLLIAAGHPLHVVRDRLGHESIQTTVDLYGHLRPDMQRAAASTISAELARVATERALTDH